MSADIVAKRILFGVFGNGLPLLILVLKRSFDVIIALKPVIWKEKIGAVPSGLIGIKTFFDFYKKIYYNIYIN